MGEGESEVEDKEKSVKIEKKEAKNGGGERGRTEGGRRILSLPLFQV